MYRAERKRMLRCLFVKSPGASTRRGFYLLAQRRAMRCSSCGSLMRIKRKPADLYLKYTEFSNGLVQIKGITRPVSLYVLGCEGCDKKIMPEGLNRKIVALQARRYLLEEPGFLHCVKEVRAGGMQIELVDLYQSLRPAGR